MPEIHYKIMVAENYDDLIYIMQTYSKKNTGKLKQNLLLFLVKNPSIYS